jgi:hypothetical protein
MHAQIVRASHKARNGSLITVKIREKLQLTGRRADHTINRRGKPSRTRRTPFF